MKNITLVPSKKESKLPFNDILSSLDKRQGFLLNEPITIPNYFVTGLGIDGCQNNFEDKLHIFYKRTQHSTKNSSVF